MKFSKIDLLTLLISLFLFASCEKTSTIGLEIDPSSGIEGTLVDSLTVSTRTIQEKPTSTGVLARYPLGFLSDPIFGTTEANISMSLGLPFAGFSFGSTPILDSAVLVLKYSTEFYGDSTQLYTFNVRQLENNIQNEELFLSNKSYSTYTSSIGSKTTRLYPNTKFPVTEIVTAGPDTLVSVQPQIRIRLDKDYIQNNILALTSPILASDFAFKNYFKGLQVKINKPSGTGAMMFFDFSTTESSLKLYYRSKNADSINTDTLFTNFLLGNSSTGVMSHKMAATVTHNYTGTPIENQLNKPNQQFTTTYLQPLSGLKTKVEFPTLDVFAEKAGRIVINKAELVIDLASGTDVAPFEAAPRISLYRFDIAEQPINLPDNSPSTDSRGLSDPATYGGYFDAVKKRYVFVITAYVQDLISKKTKNYGTFLAPTPSSEMLIKPSITSAARAIIGSHKKNAVAGDNNIKLNIYYTEIK